MKYTFPENFWWGAATSGPQSEGRFNKKHDNVFDHWFDINPELFHNGIGPNIASNFYNSYKEDLAMLKEIGLNSFRTSRGMKYNRFSSVQWSEEWHIAKW